MQKEEHEKYGLGASSAPYMPAAHFPECALEYFLVYAGTEERCRVKCGLRAITGAIGLPMSMEEQETTAGRTG